MSFLWLDFSPGADHPPHGIDTLWNNNDNNNNNNNNDDNDNNKK